MSLPRSDSPSGAQRAHLLEIKVAGGLAYAAAFLRDFMARSGPPPTYEELVKVARIITTFTLGHIPGYLPITDVSRGLKVEDVNLLLDEIRMKGDKPVLARARIRNLDRLVDPLGSEIEDERDHARCEE